MSNSILSINRDKYIDDYCQIHSLLDLDGIEDGELIEICPGLATNFKYERTYGDGLTLADESVDVFDDFTDSYYKDFNIAKDTKISLEFKSDYFKILELTDESWDYKDEEQEKLHNTYDLGYDCSHDLIFKDTKEAKIKDNTLTVENVNVIFEMSKLKNIKEIILENIHKSNILFIVDKSGLESCIQDKKYFKFGSGNKISIVTDREVKYKEKDFLINWTIESEFIKKISLYDLDFWAFNDKDLELYGSTIELQGFDLLDDACLDNTKNIMSCKNLRISCEYRDDKRYYKSIQKVFDNYKFKADRLSLSRISKPLSNINSVETSCIDNNLYSYYSYNEEKLPFTISNLKVTKDILEIEGRNSDSQAIAIENMTGKDKITVKKQRGVKIFYKDKPLQNNTILYLKEKDESRK